MSSPSTAGGHNIYTLLTVSVILIGVIFVIWRFSPQEISLAGASFKSSATSEKEELKSNYPIQGDWKMTFDYKNCDNPEFALGKLECYYDINFIQENHKVTGKGWKLSEKFKGKVYEYPKPFPIQMEGEIKGTILSLKSFERNGDREVTGKIDINLDANRFILTGIFDPDAGNCNGIIKLERVNDIN